MPSAFRSTSAAPLASTARSVDMTSIASYHQFLMDPDVEELPADQQLTSSVDVTTFVNASMFEDPYDGRVEAVVVPILFGLIFVVGVVGNGTLIFTVLVNKNMRNTPNVLLVSLALGDLFLVFFTVPIMSTIYTFDEWPYGEALCKLSEFTVTLSLGVSVFTLTALSAERYMVIVHPMSAVHRVAGGGTAPLLHTVLIAVGIWVLSAGLAAVDFVAGHLTYESMGRPTCIGYPIDWGEWYPRFHVTFRFVVYFALPITIIGVFYVMMARMLMVSTTQMPGDSVKGQAVKQLEARKKVARLVLSFVVVFIVCWLPRHVYYFWYHFDPGVYNMFWHVFKIVAFCLSFINSCVNPLALYFLSRQFRCYYDRYLCYCCCWCRGVVGGGGGASGSVTLGGRSGVGATDAARESERRGVGLLRCRRGPAGGVGKNGGPGDVELVGETSQLCTMRQTVANSVTTATTTTTTRHDQRRLGAKQRNQNTSLTAITVANTAC